MPILTPKERLGTLIAEKYRLKSVLGRGGMGVVFSAVHEWTSRPVAVKLISPEHALDRGVVRRFLAEAKAAANLRHAAVVDVLDMGRDDDGTVYLVLEKLEGLSLREHLERVGRLEVEEALDVLLPVVDALAAAHDQHVVHRDLKPDNIFLSCAADGALQPKLLDFGVAKIKSTETAATRTGTIVGTPHYMSPEQAQAATEVGPLSDVWSMGVVLFQCLSGTLPFDGRHATAVVLAIVTSKAPPLRERAPDVPEAIAACVDAMLRHDAADRPEGMREVARQLAAAAAASGLTLGARRDGPATPEHAPTAEEEEDDAPEAAWAAAGGIAEGPTVRGARRPDPLAATTPLEVSAVDEERARTGDTGPLRDARSQRSPGEQRGLNTQPLPATRELPSAPALGSARALPSSPALTPPARPRPAWLAAVGVAALALVGVIAVVASPDSDSPAPVAGDERAAETPSASASARVTLAPAGETDAGAPRAAAASAAPPTLDPAEEPRPSSATTLADPIVRRPLRTGVRVRPVAAAAELAPEVSPPAEPTRRTTTTVSTEW